MKTSHQCPHCGGHISPASILGANGGKAGRGKAKARSTETARKAAQARWAKHRKEKQP